ncbi:MAG: glycosyltransferase family 2 protein [Candidatus Daviesbacteria bacterium]|nr:glycosyltransferase family 2 protein [Candidatus Daviesbacteria bacterium]
MKKISVVLAVYNEEDNLRNCLESIKDFAWEIVIVDGGSKDKTLDIAKEFGAKIIQTNNPPVFHINKNKAIDASHGDWILQLDADEVVTEDLAEEIERVTSSKSDINGYWIPRKNFFLGRYLTKGGQYPDYTLRLYRQGSGRLPAKDVHEQAEVSGKVGYLRNDLLHERDKVFSEYLKRFNRYTDLLASQLKEKGVNVNRISFFSYIFVKPLFWFFKVFVRHKGFMDGFPGFVFAFFSSLRFPVSYLKLWRKYENRN